MSSKHIDFCSNNQNKKKWFITKIIICNTWHHAIDWIHKPINPHNDRNYQQKFDHKNAMVVICVTVPSRLDWKCQNAFDVRQYHGIDVFIYNSTKVYIDSFLLHRTSALLNLRPFLSQWSSVYLYDLFILIQIPMRQKMLLAGQWKWDARFQNIN